MEIISGVESRVLGCIDGDPTVGVALTVWPQREDDGSTVYRMLLEVREDLDEHAAALVWPRMEALLLNLAVLGPDLDMWQPQADCSLRTVIR